MPISINSDAITWTEGNTITGVISPQVISDLAGGSFTGVVTEGQIQNGAVTNFKITGPIDGTKITPNFGAQNILTTGNVGINNSSPGAKLQVAGTVEGDYVIQADSPGGSGSIALRPDGTNGNILRWGGAGTNGSILRFLRTLDVEVLRIQGGQLLSPNGTAFFGTVTNSGNSAIMEFGTSSNGNYIRFANRVQICYRLLNTNAANNLTWTYPASFSTMPFIVATAIRGSQQSFAQVHYDSGDLPGNSSVLISRWRVSGVADTCFVYVIAIGQWY
jgi:hypothetical protein